MIDSDFDYARIWGCMEAVCKLGCEKDYVGKRASGDSGATLPQDYWTYETSKFRRTKAQQSMDELISNLRANEKDLGKHPSCYLSRAPSFYSVATRSSLFLK